MGNLVAAYTVAWTVLMIYVLTLASRQRKLRRQLEQLQAMGNPAAEAENAGTRER